MTEQLPEDPRDMAQRVVGYLHSPEGRASLAEANARTDAMVETLKQTRPTKETWEWTATI